MHINTRGTLQLVIRLDAH